jgi:SPP1 gp7 family putative phage head morphogenesis protein
MAEDKKTIKELAFALTQHADDLQMFINGVSIDAMGTFEQTEDAIKELIYKLYERYEKKGLPLEPETAKYLENLQAKLAEIRENCFYDEEDEIEEIAKKMAKNESKFLKAFFFALTGQTVANLDKEWLDRISLYGVYSGGTMKQIFEKLASNDVNRLFNIMVNALRSGKSLKEARDEVQKALNKTRRDLDAEINSILNGVSNDVAKAFAVENETMLLFCTALDNSVCGACNDHEGKIYKSDDPDLPNPPLHINCRCRLIPVPNGDDKFKELEMKFSEYYQELSSQDKIKRIGKEKYELAQIKEYEIDKYEEPGQHQRISLTKLTERDKKLFLSAISKQKA